MKIPKKMKMPRISKKAARAVGKVMGVGGKKAGLRQMYGLGRAFAKEKKTPEFKMMRHIVHGLTDNKVSNRKLNRAIRHQDYQATNANLLGRAAYRVGEHRNAILATGGVGAVGAGAYGYKKHKQRVRRVKP